MTATLVTMMNLLSRLQTALERFEYVDAHTALGLLKIALEEGQGEFCDYQALNLGNDIWNGALRECTHTRVFHNVDASNLRGYWKQQPTEILDSAAKRIVLANATPEAFTVDTWEQFQRIAGPAEHQAWDSMNYVEKYTLMGARFYQQYADYARSVSVGTTV